MRYSLLALALVAASATAQDQSAPQGAPPSSPWQMAQDEKSDGLLAAFVKADDGTQLVLKCDKPGKGSVYAMIYSEQSLAHPGANPTFRNVTYRFDDGSPNKDSWRYAQHTAVALDTSREHPLVKFLAKMGDAKKMEIRLEPIDGTPITEDFDITGSQGALKQVFDSCKDTSPVR